jgi:hypothetical protein
MTPRTYVAAALVAFATLVSSAPARAQACAGFTDVDQASPFCPNVEWLKNRAITTGCTSTTLYCPTDTVSRLAMAAFMNRMGKALTPETKKITFAFDNLINLDGNGVFCATDDYLPVAYPRSVAPIYNVSLATDRVVTWNIFPWVSTDSGATWTSLATIGSPVTASAAGLWLNTGGNAVYTIAANAKARFMLRPSRLLGAAQGSNLRCHLMAVATNANGATSPFDE